MNNGFDAIAATRQLKQAGFNGRQADVVVDAVAKSRSGMASSKDIRVLWGILFGVIVPLLLLNIGLSVSIALAVFQSP